MTLCSRLPKTNLSFHGNTLILHFFNLDNQFRMSILERLEQMERRMAEMTGSQQHKQGGGGSNGSGNGGTQVQVQTLLCSHSSFILSYQHLCLMGVGKDYSFS